MLLFKKFESGEGCLKACQQIFKSKMASQYLEQYASESTSKNIKQFADFGNSE
jgi:hypothetical protein